MVGERIRKIRQLRGYPQKFVAAFLKVHQGTVSKIERGKREPKLKMLEALARLFKCRVSDLLGDPSGSSPLW